MFKVDIDDESTESQTSTDETFKPKEAPHTESVPSIRTGLNTIYNVMEFH